MPANVRVVQRFYDSEKLAMFYEDSYIEDLDDATVERWKSLGIFGDIKDAAGNVVKRQGIKAQIVSEPQRDSPPPKNIRTVVAPTVAPRAPVMNGPKIPNQA